MWEIFVLKAVIEKITENHKLIQQTLTFWLVTLVGNQQSKSPTWKV